MAFTVSRNGSSVLLVAQLRALVGVILGSSFLGPASSPLVNSKYNRTLRLTTSTLPPGPNHYYFSPRFSGDLLQALLRESSPCASQPVFNPRAGVILLECKSDLLCSKLQRLPSSLRGRARGVWWSQMVLWSLAPVTLTCSPSHAVSQPHCPLPCGICTGCSLCQEHRFLVSI